MSSERRRYWRRYDDPDRTRLVVRKAVVDLGAVSPIGEPKVVLERFGDSATLELQFWIENPERRRVQRARTGVISAVEAAFDREGITSPFPVHPSLPERKRVPRRDPVGNGQEPPGGRVGVESMEDDL